MPGIVTHLSPERESLYREALGRLCPLEDFTGLITGDPTVAAAATVPCLLDQPHALGAAQIEGLMTSPARIMPAHQLRFLPEIVPIKQSADRGKLGVPGLLRAHLWVNDDALPVEQLAAGCADLAGWLFGARAEIVHCLRKTNYLQLHLGFPGDAMALIDVATHRPGPDNYLSVHLIGSAGAVYADDHRNAHLLFASAGTRALVHQPNLVLATQKMLAEFVGGEWQLDLADTLVAHQCLQAEGVAHG